MIILAIMVMGMILGYALGTVLVATWDSYQLNKIREECGLDKRPVFERKRQ